MPNKILKPKFRFKKVYILSGLFALIIFALALLLITQDSSHRKYVESLNNSLISRSAELDEFKNQDQVKINEELKEKIASTESGYSEAVKVYEELVKLRGGSAGMEALDAIFASIVTLLSELNYDEAAKLITDLQAKISAEQEKIASTFVIPSSAPVSNAPPGQGYSRQQVATDIGNYLISMVAADLASTRVIVDTASAGDCGNDCPTLSLATYVSRNGAFAGVNGSYFCPASYPSCAGKTNTFDTLLMNKDKVYFNSANNVYSNVPAVIFGNGYARFIAQSLEWGRDTGIDSMIANQPLLVLNGNIQFTGDGDPKKGSKGNRSFVGSKGSSIYIGVVHNVTVAESAIVLAALGLENALNLDSGGSTALWSGGYRAGPGRDIPNAILFVAK